MDKDGNTTTAISSSKLEQQQQQQRSNDAARAATASANKSVRQQQQHQQQNTNDTIRKKGFGLHDWMILLRSAKDIAQRKGLPLRNDISIAEVQTHNKSYDAWITLSNKVYNITPYLPYHPGGENIMKSVLGKDATILFHKYHTWVNIDTLIGPLLLGTLLALDSKKKKKRHSNEKKGDDDKDNADDDNDDDDDDDEDDISGGRNDTVMPYSSTNL